LKAVLADPPGRQASEVVAVCPSGFERS